MRSSAGGLAPAAAGELDGVHRHLDRRAGLSASVASPGSMSGSWPLVLRSASVVDQVPVLLGQAHELADDLRREAGGDVVHELDVALLGGVGHDLAADRRGSGPPCSAMTVALKLAASGRRYATCRGGSIARSMSRIMLEALAGRGPRSRPRPRSAENRFGFARHVTTSAWLSTAQKPGSPGMSCQATGVVRRSSASDSCGGPSRNVSGSARSSTSLSQSTSTFGRSRPCASQSG